MPDVKRIKNLMPPHQLIEGSLGKIEQQVIDFSYR
jgi:hypothetical protein